jgi:DNA-directed RNA polymerase specialized sigma24 family protein
MNRCAKKIAEGEEIRDVATYSIGVARMFLKEISRERVREAPLDAGPEPRTLPVEPETDREIRTECLRCCLAGLPAENREFILSYYEGDKGEKIRNRKELNQQFGIPASTLRMRALRMRETLQRCAEKCMQRTRSNLL